MNSEVQRELFKKSKYVFDDSLIDIKKIEKIALMYHKLSFECFFNDEVIGNHLLEKILSDEAFKGFDELVHLCLIYNINFVETLELLFKLFIEQFNIIERSWNVSIMEDNFVSENYIRIFEVLLIYLENCKNNKEDTFKLISNCIKQEAMETTFEIVEKKLKNMELGKYKNINLSKFLKQELNDLSDFEDNKRYMNDIFSNPKVTSRLYTKTNPHFMNKLSNDNLVYCNNTDSFYFKNLEESLSLAYTDKYLLINIDKKQAIKGLNETLKGLEIVISNEIEIQKNFIKELINLIQNTNTNYYPFKVVGKALGMNKNEARNYAIKILNTVNPQVFNKQYES